MTLPLWLVPVLVSILKIVIKVLEGNTPESPAHLLDQVSTDVIRALPGNVDRKKKGRPPKTPTSSEVKSDG